SRLPLALTPIHPDRLGGVGGIVGPSYAFSSVIAAMGVAGAAGWADRMAREGVPFSTFHGIAITFAAVAAVLAAAPLWTFAHTLYRCRADGLRDYGAFAARYC